MKPFDPKLREAAKEFRALCEKYDCAGVTLFVSPTHSEFVNHITPTWSLMHFEAPDRIRFRSKREDFATAADQHQATEATAHILTSIIEWSRQTNSAMRGVVEQLSKHMKIAWRTWGQPDSVPKE